MLAVFAGLGVLAAGCTSNSADTEDWGAGAFLVYMFAPSDPYQLPSPSPNCPHNINAVTVAGECIVFDIQGTGWAFLPNYQLPLPHAIDQDACELPSGLPYTEAKPARRPANAHMLRVTRTDNGDIAVRIDNDPTAYLAVADDEDADTHTDRFRGTPYFFRPCPRWAK